MEKPNLKSKWLSPTYLIVGMSVVLGVIMIATNIVHLISNLSSGNY